MAEEGRLILLAAKKLGLGQPDREEVFQNTCLSVVRFIGSLRDPARLDAWVYSIAYRHSLDLIRRRRPGGAQSVEPPGGIESLELQEPGALETMERLERIRQLQGALGGLPARCRRLLSALYLDVSNPTYEEIRRKVGIPVGSIGPTRARCLKKLRRLLSSVSGAAALKST